MKTSFSNCKKGDLLIPNNMYGDSLKQGYIKGFTDEQVVFNDGRTYPIEILYKSYIKRNDKKFFCIKEEDLRYYEFLDYKVGDYIQDEDRNMYKILYFIDETIVTDKGILPIDELDYSYVKTD